jgi:hypothetical protein
VTIVETAAYLARAEKLLDEAERDAIKAMLGASATEMPTLAGGYRFYVAVSQRESLDTKLARKTLAPDVLNSLLRVTETRTLKIEEAM